MSQNVSSASDHRLGALGSGRRKPVTDRPGQWAVGPLIWLLTADDKRQHAFLGVFADSESEPASTGAVRAGVQAYS